MLLFSNLLASCREWLRGFTWALSSLLVMLETLLLIPPKPLQKSLIGCLHLKVASLVILSSKLQHIEQQALPVWCWSLPYQVLYFWYLPSEAFPRTILAFHLSQSWGQYKQLLSKMYSYRFCFPLFCVTLLNQRDK